MTRGQILRAAAHQFARRPYHDVGLDDILATAELTKGAMYFHFRSKHALALAVIEEQLAADEVAVAKLLKRQLSGLETVIDIGYLMAVQDLSRESARAVLHLLPAIGWAEGLQARLVAHWVEILEPVLGRAVAEGDLVEGPVPAEVARVLIAMYLGLRQSGDLDDPGRYLGTVQHCWAVVLPGIVPAERAGYFTQFVSRRTALAVRAVSAGPQSVDLTDELGG